MFTLAAVTAFAEVLTLGALYPFMVLLVAPEKAASIEFVQHVLAALPSGSREQTLWVLTGGFVLAVLAATMLRVSLLFAQTKFVNRLGSHLSVEVYRRTLHQPYSVHVGRNSSQVIAVIAGKVNGVVSSILMPIVVIGSSLIMLTAVMGSLLAIQPAVALAMLGGFAGIYALVVFTVKARLDRESEISAEQQIVTVKALQEGLGGIRDILLDGTQNVFCEVYRNADRKARSAAATVGFIANLPRSVIEGLGMVLISLIACMLALASNDVSGVIPVLGVVALGAQRLLPLVQGLYAQWGTMRGHVHALQDVLALLNQALPTGSNDLQPAREAPSLPFKRSIELQALSFRYAANQRHVLADIDLRIHKGARVGVIGTTGSGKSTLIDLLLGLLRPTGGCIRVDGIALDDNNVRAWQCHVAHVPQSIFLADATVAENIAFGQPPHLIDNERVKQAARRAQIASAIEVMPQGYATRIGERGVRLSGGQRQRIGIARALYKQADVLVLDEATSALDNQTEAMVMEAVEQLDPDLTVIMIAHRLTTLHGCDLIVELVDGTAEVRGTYAELMKRNSEEKMA